jgi:hypothetical protein
MAATLTCPLPSCAIVPGAAARFGVPAALGGGIHTGLDLVASYGTPVYAANGGLVRSWWDVGGGLLVEVRESDRFATRYAHLSRVALPGLAGRGGQVVSAGQLIAYSGASGLLVVGPHLHFEVLVDGQVVDPAPYLGLGGSLTVEQPPSTGISAFPLDIGKSCPPGYNAGTVNPRIAGAIPFGIWFGRPTNPDGTVNACVLVGVQPGTNLAAADIGAAVVAGLIGIVASIGAAVLVVGVPVGAAILALAGARRILS